MAQKSMKPLIIDLKFNLGQQANVYHLQQYPTSHVFDEEGEIFDFIVLDCCLFIFIYR